MSNLASSRANKLTQRSSLITKIDTDTASDDDEHVSSPDERVPHFGGQEAESESGSDDLKHEGENSDADEEDETDLLCELRQLSKNMMSSNPSTKRQKKDKDIADTVEDLTAPKKSVKEFNTYYQSSFQRFLKKKEDDLEKLRKQKEEAEVSEIKNKPNLVAKQTKKKHVPIADRIELIKAKKEREIMKLKKEQEAKIEKELSELTFAPKINHSSSLPTGSQRKQATTSNQKPQVTSKDQVESIEVKEEAFKPKINKNSDSLAKGIIENTSKDVVERLYNQAQLNKSRKKELAHQYTPLFTPQINKNTTAAPRYMEGVADQEGYDDRIEGLFTDKSKAPLKSRGSSTRNSVQEFKNSHSQERKQSASFLAEQELLMRKFHEFLGGDPNNQANLRKLEGLVDFYADQKDGPKPVTSKAVEIKESPRKTPVKESPRKEPEMTPVKSNNKKETQGNEGKKTTTDKSISPVKITFSPPANRIEEQADEMDDSEGIEIANIKQSLLSIQDNIHTLKESFKNFQNAQVDSKNQVILTETPKKETAAKRELQAQTQTQGQAPSQALKNFLQQPNKLEVEKRSSPQSRNSIISESSLIIKKEPVPLVASDTRSKTPTPQQMTKTLPVVDNNKAKIVVSPVPKQKTRNGQCIVLPSDGTSYAKRLAKPAQNGAGAGSNGKAEGKKEYCDSARAKESVNNEFEVQSFGNMSFSANKDTGNNWGKNDQKVSPNKIVKVNPFMEKDDRRLKTEGSESDWGNLLEKSGSDYGQLMGSNTLSSNLMAKQKTNNNTQSLKEIAQMTLMKFKGLDRQHAAGGEEGYSGLKRK